MSSAPDESARTPSLLGSSAIMAAGTVVSRLTGFGRSAIIAAALGLGVVADVFNVANVVPNMLYILVGGGVLNSVLVPALVRAIKNDADQGEAYSQRLFSVTVAVLGASTVVFVLAAPLLMRVVVDDSFLEPDMRPYFDNMVMLARYCLPQIFFYGLYVLIGQMLNARGRFGPMMWSPILNNVVSIAVFALYIVVFGSNASEPLTSTEVMLLGGGSTLGIAVQALALMPVLRTTGFSLRFRTDWRGHGLSEPIKLGVWTFGFVAVNQVAYLVFVNVATGASAAVGGGTGAGYTVYANAMLILMVPHSVITVSLATALLPRLSDLAADGHLQEMRERISGAIRTCLAIIVPIAALMAALASPLAALLFNYGAARGETGTVAMTLIALLPGLVGFTIHYLALRGFYAVQDTRTPFFTQIWVAASMITWAFGMRLLDADPDVVTILLGAGYSVAYVIGASVGLLRLQRSIGSLGIARVLRHLVRVTLPAAAAGAVSYLIAVGLSALGLDEWLPNLIGQLLILTVAGVIGLAIFVGIAYAMPIREVRRAVALVRSKLARQPIGVLDDETDAGAGAEVLAAETGTLSIFRRPMLDPEMTAEFFLDETLPGVPGFWESASTRSTAVPPPAGPSLGDTLAHQRPQVPPVGPPSSDRGSILDDDRARPAVPLEGLAPSATAPVDYSRTIAGRYRLEELLDVTDGVRSWRAIDTVLRRSVFVQTIVAHDSRTGAFAAAARAASTVDDPHFLRVLDIGTDDDAYVVREWTPGADLATILTTASLPPDQAASIAREVAEALTSAHAQGLSHQRLDPTLVLVTTDGSVKIAGLQTEVALHGMPAVVSEDTGAHLIDAASLDAYGIGAVLYAGLTGRWPTGTPGNLPPAPRIDGRLASPRQVRPGVPRAFDLIADRALGHARRHHASPLPTPAAILAELDYGSPSRGAVRGYDVGPQGEAPPALIEDPTPPSTRARAATPPPPNHQQRSGRTARLLGVIGAALLLVGATMVGLQLLLGAIEGSDRGAEESPESSGTSGTATTSPPAQTEQTPLTIAGAEDFDPLGNGEENRDDVEQAFDGDPETAWMTVTYYDPLEAQKDGVGIVLDLGGDQAVREVRLQLARGGSDLDVRVAPEGSGEAPDDIDDWTTVGQLEDADREAAVSLAEPLTTRYVLVWFTRLPADNGDFRGGVAEAEVLG